MPATVKSIPLRRKEVENQPGVPAQIMIGFESEADAEKAKAIIKKVVGKRR